MGFVLKEHVSGSIVLNEDIGVDTFDTTKISLSLTEGSFVRYQHLKSKIFKPGHYCYEINHVKEENKIDVHPGYFIGLDWLVTGERYIQVEPKINKKVSSYFNIQSLLDEEEQEAAKQIEEQAKRELIVACDDYIEINYLKMLIDVMSDSNLANECANLVKIDWTADSIIINQRKDQLTPFLIVQYLQLLRQIVRKGLKKSYYKVHQNLNNRIKGKVLVGIQIKQNLLKNRLTKTYCSFQEFGLDSPENRFLKRVLSFISSYVENNPDMFASNQQAITNIINYVRPVFEQVSNVIDGEQLHHQKYNPFFKEYKEAIQIGQYILKRFSYNITRTSLQEDISMPPFWIDMPKLFELYIYQKMLAANGYNREKIKYQFSTYGNALDILLKDGANSMIIDAKYKLHYINKHVHQDIRQVAGYARLIKVRTELDVLDDTNIDCLIIYPDMDNGVENLSLDFIAQKRQEIKVYHKVFKLGVKLPLM